MVKQKRIIVPHRDQYVRMSHMYQASLLFGQNPQTSSLSNMYALQLKNVAKKNVLRMSPHIKRNMCRKCCTVLIPGFTSQYRVENTSKSQSPHNDIVEVTCLSCSTVKRFPVGKKEDFELWTDRADEQ